VDFIDKTAKVEQRRGRAEASTDKQPLSISDLDMSRSSMIRMGKMGGGVDNRPLPDRPVSSRPDIRTSYDSRISFPF